MQIIQVRGKFWAIRFESFFDSYTRKVFKVRDSDELLELKTKKIWLDNIQELDLQKYWNHQTVLPVYILLPLFRALMDEWCDFLKQGRSQ